MTPQDNIVFPVRDVRPSNPPDRIYSIKGQFPASIGPNVLGGVNTAVHWMFSPYIAFGSEFPTSLLGTDFGRFKIVGSPALANGILYAVGSDGAKVAVLALNANPRLTFTVDKVKLAGSTMTIRQIDANRSTNLSSVYITLIEGVNFTKDLATGNITITDCYDRTSGDTFNIAAPFYISVGDTNELERVPARMNNLVWSFILPGNFPNGASSLPAGSPTVIGKVAG